MNNFKLLTNFLHQVAVEIHCIVCNNDFWYAKMTYDVGMNEVHPAFLETDLNVIAFTHLLK